MNQITGKIIAILDPVTGESKKNPGTMWMRQEFVLETQDTYPRKVNFNLWGEARIKAADIKMDDLVTVDFDLESREYQGRWYTSVNGINVTKGMPAYGPQPQAYGPQPYTPQPQPYAQPTPTAPLPPQSTTPVQPTQPAAPTGGLNNGGGADDLPF